MSADLSSDDKTKMRTAQSLIKEQRYPEARALLVQVNHPKATEWIMRIDAIPKPVPPKQSHWGTWIAVLIVLAVVGGIAYTVYSSDAQNRHKAREYICSVQYQTYSTAWSNCVADTR